MVSITDRISFFKANTSMNCVVHIINSGRLMVDEEKEEGRERVEKGKQEEREKKREWRGTKERREEGRNGSGETGKGGE